MTRKEIIDFCDMKAQLEPENEDVFNAIIKALEQEPTTKNDVPENNAENIYICSCGYGWDKSKVVRYHFCPNCGKAVASATKNDLGDDKTFYEQMVEYCNEHFLVLVEKDVWEDAKKALTTKNDLGVDAVSRQEVLELIADDDLSMGQVVRGIHALPSVTPQEPRKGHWFVDERPESDREVVCSNCDQPIFKYHKLDFDYRPKYCPNCGSYNGGTSNGNE